MKGQALGLIETYGYVGAIEAANASLKAANIELMGIDYAKGGLVTIMITGDIGAVKASVDAGATAADKVGKVVSVDVIARTAYGLENVLNLKNNFKDKEEKNKEIEKKEKQEDTDKEIEKDVKKENQSHNRDKRSLIINYKGKKIDIKNKDKLLTLKVTDLRKIARMVDNISIEKKQIKFAKKNQLIDALTKCSKEEVK
ncbi:BMC domain-containing protein [Dethiothermospora halolimnae]|uniref:BMC domain-containing protein n=1 Tax=Dethiothermospora halolimnae TaxID=3114390 RepID=UPI003CCC0650